MSEQPQSMPPADVVNLGSFAFYTGMIAFTLDTVAAPGFVLLQTGGSTVAIVDHPSLYAILGTRYGGDGATTFGLPPADMFLAGPSAAHPLWSRGGEEQHTLTEAELARHGHVVDDPEHTHGFDKPPASSGPGAGAILATAGGTAPPVIEPAATGISIEPAGGDQPHNNLPPFHRVNVMVKD